MKLVVWLCVCLTHCIALKFAGVTDHVRLGGARGKVVGFADLNADKATDILFQSGENISVFLWSRAREKFRAHHLLTLDSVVHTVPVDLDSDGQVDLLTLSSRGEREREREGKRKRGKERERGDCSSMAIHWLRPQSGGPTIEKTEVLAESVLSPPLVLDANGDHVPDLLTHSCVNNTATLWTSKPLLRELQPQSVHSSIDYSNAYYVDLTDDYLADVVVEGWGPSGWSLVFWQRDLSCDHELLTFRAPSLPVPLPLSSSGIFSPLSFTDMDGDGETEAVRLSCTDKDCSSLQAHILSHKTATIGSSCSEDSETQPVNFSHIHTVTVHDVSISPSSISSAPPVLGDVNLDGASDILVPASDRSSSSRLLVLVARQCHDNCNGSKVTLEPQWIPVAMGNITSVFFFDIWEDGVLDVLVGVRPEAESTDHHQQQQQLLQLLALRHHLQFDHAFLKVLVLSGHCYHDCRSGQVPYGSVLPGVVVRFSTTDRMGRRKQGIRTLTSGHAHQLPFTIFGLGQTPSLVEKLEVGVAGEGVATSRKWTNLVPNSQIIIVPSPPGQPLHWTLELYLTPGHLVYNTAAVLAALFLATAILVLLLQAREKFQDTKEKRMAKHKFHFNAM